MRSMGTPRVNGWIPESTQIKWCLAGRHHISCHCETSAHTGRGNPPAPWNQVTIITKNRKVSPLCGAVVDTFSI